MSKASRLIELPVEEARKKKWEIGRREHGKIMKLDPVLELHAELLDAINYTKQLEDDKRFEAKGMFKELGRRLTGIADDLRLMYALQGSHGGGYKPTEYKFK